MAPSIHRPRPCIRLFRPQLRRAPRSPTADARTAPKTCLAHSARRAVLLRPLVFSNASSGIRNTTIALLPTISAPWSSDLTTSSTDTDSYSKLPNKRTLPLLHLESHSSIEDIADVLCKDNGVLRQRAKPELAWQVPTSNAAIKPSTEHAPLAFKSLFPDLDLNRDISVP